MQPQREFPILCSFTSFWRRSSRRVGWRALSCVFHSSRRGESPPEVPTSSFQSSGVCEPEARSTSFVADTKLQLRNFHAIVPGRKRWKFKSDQWRSIR